MTAPRKRIAQRFFDLSHEIEEAFSSLIDEPWGREGRKEWYVAVDIYETGSEYIITIDVPGVKLDDIKLKIHPYRIQVTGKREKNMCSGTADCLHRERIEGCFCRRFNLDHPVDPNEIKSELKSGILIVRIGKKLVTGRNPNDKPDQGKTAERKGRGLAGRPKAD